MPGPGNRAVNELLIESRGHFRGANMRRPETEGHLSKCIFFEIKAQNTELVFLRLGKIQETFDPLRSWYKG